MQRGKIRNRERAKQLRDFTGLRFGRITPTDIDAFLEFGDVLFILIESKQEGAQLPYGQKTALERLCDAVQGTKTPTNQERQAYILIVHHTTTETDQDVDYGASMVSSVRYKRKWCPPKEPITCRQAIDKIREQWL